MNSTHPSAVVSVGTTVTWTNRDAVLHTVTADDGGFSSTLLGRDQSFSYTFDTPGVYFYFCQPHGNMTGSITVQ